MLLSDNIRRQKLFWKNRRNNAAATNKGEIAIQLGLSSDFPKYYGLSNKGLALMLRCKTTRACVLKQKAQKAGYIEVIHRFQSVKKMKSWDYRIREELYETFPGLRGRLHFKKVNEKGEWIIHLMQQLHDEIRPNIIFGSVKM